MNIGLVGLGKMGGAIFSRLTSKGFHVEVYDPNANLYTKYQLSSHQSHASLETLVAALPEPRCLWIMVPAGETTEGVIVKSTQLLSKDDVIIDGGNSHYKDTMRVARSVVEHSLQFADIGTSGGVRGETLGFSMTIGSTRDTYERISPILDALSPDGSEVGHLLVGPYGAGHFVKMVHNGIEYGLMEAYAEGFALLNRTAAFDLDLSRIADTWNQGSVVRSWLLGLIIEALEEDATLSRISPIVSDSGEGRWTIEEAIDSSTPVPVIAASLWSRFSSQDSSYADRLLAKLRNVFGGHPLQGEDHD